jgi:hypothetical protein
MAYNVNDYFQLGLDSEAMPQNSLVMNTIRTPPDTTSGRTALSKIVFKCPKVGLLTGDSMLTFQVINNGGTNSNVTPNFITGALGAISRVRILIDNKELTNLENPSLLEVPKMYSRNTQNEVAQFSYKFLGEQFQAGCNDSNGNEEFDTRKTRYFTDAAGNTDTQNVIRYRPNLEADSHVYGIHLKNLGAQFLENRSLPVFLLGSREMVIEVFFHTDCRQYLVATQGTLAAADYAINYPNVELVTTHIQIPDEVQAQEIAALGSNPVNYPLLDNYLVKGTYLSDALNTAKEKIFRINCQNRELHKLLMVNSELTNNIASNQRLVANQKAVTLGDVRLQIKSNGLNLYERPIVNPSLLYQQTTYAHNGMSLKLPYAAFNVDNRVNAIPQSDQTLYLNYRGTQQYLAVDFQNGNGGVYGGGSVQRQAMEIEYQATPRIAANPTQTARQVETLFYLEVSKMLTIGANNVEISF